MFTQLWFVFVLVGSLHASKNAIPWNLSEAITRVDHYISAYTLNMTVPSLSFGIAQKGELIWTKAYGYADLENSVLAKTSTRYRLASISKSFTASLIGAFVDACRMSFDDPLSDHLSSGLYPTKYWKGEPVNLTIGQLLSHTGGTYSAEDEVDYFRDVILAHNVTECIQKRKNVPLKFKPGTDWAYSNYGFLLLGAVIESVTKQSYAQAMREHLDHLGLHSTVVETVESIVPDRARSYRSSNDSKLIPSPLYDELYMAEAEWSDGNLMSNVGDMLKYAQLWIDSYKGRNKTTKYLSRETVRQMWSPHSVGLKGIEDEVKEEGRGPFQYGYAWFVSNDTNETTHKKEHHSVWHSGGAFGVANLLTIYPEEEIAVVVLCSRGDVEGREVLTQFAVDNLINLK